MYRRQVVTDLKLFFVALNQSPEELSAACYFRGQVSIHNLLLYSSNIYSRTPFSLCHTCDE